MSAVELIERFKTLPAEGRAEVRDFVLKFEGEDDENAKPSYEEVRDRVFRKHDRLLRELAK